MKASIIAASAAIVGSVAAAHKAHAGFHLRRGAEPVDEVCTVYTTVYVYPSEIPTAVANSTVYVHPTPEVSTPCTEDKTSEVPQEKTSEVPPPPPSTKDAYTPAPPAYTPPVYTPEPKPSKEAYTPAPPAYTPEPKPSKVEVKPKPKPSKPAKVPSYSGGGRIVTNGNKFAMTYTPYTPDGQCKGQGEVKTDIGKIADMGFTTIRVYSTDCFVFDNVVPAAKEHNLKIIYGIFLEAGGKGGKGPFSDYANNQLQEIISKTPKDSVAMIIVGNEALFNNYCTPEELASYISYVKEQLHSNGFPSDIAITTTEPVDVWENKGQALCSVIDVFAVQVHPFFTQKVYASEAGSFAKEQLEQAAKVCPEAAAKGKYITEIGWPKQGNSNGNAVPGYAEQKEAIKNILETVGKEATLFSFHDDKWKEPGAYGVEQSWGCADAIN